jgi:hypothetical protein
MSAVGPGARRAATRLTVVVSLLATAASGAAQPVPPVRLNVSTAGAQANGSSFFDDMMPDGRVVVFESSAPNLVDGDTNGQFDHPAGQHPGPGIGRHGRLGVDHGTQPLSVELAMYRTVGSQPFAAGHASAGVTAATTSWFLAEGATGDFFDLFVDLPANSRTTVPLHASAGFTNRRYGVLVESIDTAPLAQRVVERAMYWNAGGAVWAAGTNLLATPIP